MATQSEITATEKLLEFIRHSPSPTEQNQALAPGPPPQPPSPGDERLKARPMPAAEKHKTGGLPAPSLPVAGQGTGPSRTTARPQAGFLDTIKELGGEVKIGIDIQPNALNLIKLLSTKSGRKVIAHQRLPFESAAKDLIALCQDPQFKALLSGALASFRGKRGSPELWCSAALTQVSIHNIIIPKLPPKETAKAVFWSTKREVPFDDQQTLFDFSILKEFEEGGHPKTQTLVTLVPQPEVTGLENLFAEIGYPLTGLTMPATAIQNLLEADPHNSANEAIAYFNIHRNRSTIDLFFQGKMLFSREIKTGADSFIESAIDYAGRQALQLTDDQARAWIFTAGSLAGQTDTAGEPAPHTALEITALPVIDRFIRQLSRTFEYCITHFKVPVITKIYTSGGTVLHPGILAQVEKKLSVKCTVLDPGQNRLFSFKDKPEAAATLPMVTASGLALSRKATTRNFLYTYKERQQAETSQRLNKIIAVVTLIALIAIAVFSARQYQLIDHQQLTLTALQEELARNYLLSPHSRSPARLINSLAKIRQIDNQNSETLSRFQIIGIIQEAAADLPAGIKLTDFALVLEPESDKTEAASKKGAPATNMLRLTGFVSAPKEEQEFVLLKFIKNLLNKKLITNPILLATGQGSHEDTPTLDFKIQLTPVTAREPSK